nr:hypothetical protein [Methylibium sp.]
VLLSELLDFIQEHRAGKAAEKLRESVALRASVVRDGRPGDIAIAGIVPGDVVLLWAGDRVLADARLMEARDLFVNQALLTGESYPVEKRPGALEAGATELQQASNAVFKGTTVVSGSARVLVIATGARTALGDIARVITAEPPPTAFELGTQRFGMLIMRLTIAMVLFVLFVNRWRSRWTASMNATCAARARSTCASCGSSASSAPCSTASPSTCCCRSCTPTKPYFAPAGSSSRW